MNLGDNNINVLVLVLAIAALIVPLNYVLFNFFLENIYLNNERLKLKDTWAGKVYGFFFFFMDRLNSELALNAIFFSFFILFVNHLKPYKELLVWGFIILKVIIFHFHSLSQKYRDDSNTIMKIWEQIKKEIYKNNNETIGSKITMRIKFFISMVMRCTIFFSPIFILDSPTYFAPIIWTITNYLAICLVAILLHLLAWILLILLWIPGATLFFQLKKSD